MDKKDKEIKKLQEILIYVYDYDQQDVIHLTDQELTKLIAKEQDKALKTAKNPNKFFAIKDLPPPQEFKTKTSAKGGVIVFCAFLGAMLLFGSMMFMWAFGVW